MKRPVTRDKVISWTDKGPRVGVYYADTDGTEILFSANPETADRLIALWNSNLEEPKPVVSPNSAVIKRIAEEHGIELTELQTTSLEPQDIIGFPVLIDGKVEMLQPKHTFPKKKTTDA